MLGRDLLAICAGEAEGELSDLNDTRNTQPALFVIESLLVDGLRAQGRQADLMAGHSLGELVALYAAGVFDVTTGLELMRSRSTLMASGGGGAMTAVMGFERARLEELVAANPGVVIANDNSSAQVVLSGTPEAVAQGYAAGTALGCLVTAQDVADMAVFLASAPRISGQVIAVDGFTINPDPKV